MTPLRSPQQFEIDRKIGISMGVMGDADMTATFCKTQNIFQWLKSGIHGVTVGCFFTAQYREEPTLCHLALLGLGLSSLVIALRIPRSVKLRWWMAPSDGIECAKMVFLQNPREEPSTMVDVTTIGLDIAKNVFVRPASRVSFCFTGGEIS